MATATADSALKGAEDRPYGETKFPDKLRKIPCSEGISTAGAWNASANIPLRRRLVRISTATAANRGPFPRSIDRSAPRRQRVPGKRRVFISALMRIREAND